LPPAAVAQNVCDRGLARDPSLHGRDTYGVNGSGREARHAIAHASGPTAATILARPSSACRAPVPGRSVGL